MSTNNSKICSELMWKIIPIVFGSSIIATGIGGIYYDIFLKPNIQFEFNRYTFDHTEKLSITIVNQGGSPATNLKILLVSPYKILENTISTSEKSNVSKTNSTSLRIELPRLANGYGSFTKINLIADNTINKINYNYVLFISYDQGSKKIIFNSLYETAKSDTLLQSIFFPLILISTGLSILISLAIYLRYFKKRYGRQFMDQKRQEIEETFLEFRRSEREPIDLIQALIKIENIKENIDDVYSNKGYMKYSDHFQLNKEIDKIMYVLFHSQDKSIKEIKDDLNKMIIDSTITFNKYIEIYNRITNFEYSSALKD